MPSLHPLPARNTRHPHRLAALLASALLSACTGLLPTSKQAVSNQWQGFDDAKHSFDQIVPYRSSMDDVRELGFDPARTPNVQILNHSQVVRAVQAGQLLPAVELHQQLGLRGPIRTAPAFAVDDDGLLTGALFDLSASDLPQPLYAYRNFLDMQGSRSVQDA